MSFNLRKMIFFSVFLLIILQSLAVSNMESNIKEIEVLQTDNIETDFSEKQLIEPDTIVGVGSGSYRTNVPPPAFENEDMSTPPSMIWKTDNLKGPIPTNDWISSILFTEYSETLYAHPLSYKAVSSGMEVSVPHNSGGGQFHHSTEFIIGGSDFEPTEARLDKASDWFADIMMIDGTDLMKATIGHGSPYAYFEMTSGNVIFNFVDDITIYYNSDDHVGLTTARGNNYGLFAPTGSVWSGVNTGTNQISISLSSDFFSIVGLPDGNIDTLELFSKYAYNFVSDTKVNWEYDGFGSLITSYEVTTTPMQGTTTDTILLLYPHQWRESVDVSFLEYNYFTVRGLMKSVIGTSYQTSFTYSGVLPMLPSNDNMDMNHLNALLEEGIANLDLSGPIDTYWGGKEVGRLTQLLPIAEQVGNNGALNIILNALKGELQRWLTADGQEDFYYDSNWGTLIGYPASYGSNGFLNDHHFHYGYWVQAAAAVALRDPEWASEDQWGGMINLLIRDYASPSRNDAMFPFLRNYDIYEGHSWASGNAMNPGGNNQESSSEAINSHAALILWGELTGNDTIRDLGIFLYTNEVRAINNYYFDIHEDVFVDSYDHVVASLVWGSMYSYTTYFGGDAKFVHGIVLLPITPASIYLGMDPNYVQRNYDQAYERSSLDVWDDIFTEYLALTDPWAAIDKANELKMWELGGSGYSPEAGGSKAQSYHWVHNFAGMGLPDFTITSNTPFSNVFKNGVQNNYVVYNAQNVEISVTFSNGYVIDNVPPRSQVVYQELEGPAFELNTEIIGDGRISPSGGLYAENSDIELTAIPKFGWEFDHWEGDLSGNTNPVTINLDNDKYVTAIFREIKRGENLALYKPAMSSSNEDADLKASNAVDGDLSTRWSSQFSDPQWIYIDLQNLYSIDKVILTWEEAYANNYEIRLSNDTVNWKTVYVYSNGDGGIDEIDLKNANGRYIKMHGISRATGWGYSLLEFEVYSILEETILDSEVRSDDTATSSNTNSFTKSYVEESKISRWILPSSLFTIVFIKLSMRKRNSKSLF